MIAPHLPIEILAIKYTVTVRKKFNTLQETSERHTPNDEYENLVIALMETEAECISTNQSAKCCMRVNCS